MDPNLYDLAKREGRVIISDKAEQLDSKDEEVLDTKVTYTETQFDRSGNTIEVTHTQALSDLDETIAKSEAELVKLQAQRQDIVDTEARRVSGKAEVSEAEGAVEA
jgi:hypothetical protein